MNKFFSQRSRLFLRLGAALSLLVPLWGFGQYPAYGTGVTTTVSRPQTIKDTPSEKQKLLQRLAAQQSTQLPDQQALNEAYRLVMQQYAFDQGQPNHAQLQNLSDGAIAGMIRALNDPYSEYIPPANLSETQDELEGNYQGIGAFIEEIDGKIMVTTPLKNGPAEKAGLLPNDEIVLVDGVSVLGLSASEAGKLVRGPANTTVTISVQRAESASLIDLTIIRSAIELPSVTFEFIGANAHNSKIPVLHLHQFTSETTDLAISALQSAHASAPISQLVLDLRLNPGGYVNQAEGLAKIFLKTDEEMFRIEYVDREVVYRASADGFLSDIDHIIVLADAGTASSSEMLIGALKTHRNVTVIGQETYGKGVVQSFFEISNGGALKLTTAKWYTPDNHWVSASGLKPDITINFNEDNRELFDIIRPYVVP